MFDKMFDTGKIMEVVNLVWDNRDQIKRLIEQLPQTLKESGDNIESAGNSAVRAGYFFGGGGPDKEAVDASQLSRRAATALTKCQREIKDAARMMERVGAEIDDIWIPSVKPKYLEVLGHKVVSGLDIGENKLMGEVATKLKDGSDNLGNLGDELQDIAKSLRELSGVLRDAGGDMVNVGEQLVKSGHTLREMSSLSNIIDKLDGDD